MLEIIPFRAVRPRRDMAPLVAASPYDVVSLAEARKIAADNPFSFLRVEKTGVDLPASQGIDDPYRLSRENLDHLTRAGIMVQEAKESFYLYRQIMGDHRQYGLVGCVSIKQYEEGIIKRHELTRTEKELDRINHIMAVDAQTGPVLVVYRASPVIDEIMARLGDNQAEYDFTTADGIKNTVWVIDRDEEIERIQKAFLQIKTGYIADGHHRAAAAAEVGRRKRRDNRASGEDFHYNYLLAVFSPHHMLQILAYNRVVKDLNGLTGSQFLQAVERNFLVAIHDTCLIPASPVEMGMFFNNRWYRLEAREGFLNGKDFISLLPVSLLQDGILQPVLGVDDPRVDDRLDFVGGRKAIEEMEKMVRCGRYAVAFSLFPTTIDQLMNISDSGLLMPPKSTWFEPKLLSGLFVHPLGDRVSSSRVLSRDSTGA